jgi:hypothetical protein
MSFLRGNGSVSALFGEKLVLNHVFLLYGLIYLTAINTVAAFKLGVNFFESPAT